MSLLQPKFPNLSNALSKPKFPVHDKLQYPLRKRKSNKIKSFKMIPLNNSHKSPNSKLLPISREHSN